MSVDIANLRAYWEIEGLIYDGQLNDDTVIQLLTSIESALGDTEQKEGRRLLIAQPYFLHYVSQRNWNQAQEYFFPACGGNKEQIELSRKSCRLRNMYFCYYVRGHWILIHVRRPRQSMPGEIWFMDSLRNYYPDVVKNLKLFLGWVFPQEKYKLMNFDQRHGICPLPRGFPQQGDSVSCGVFVAVYLEALLQGEMNPVDSVDIRQNGNFSIQQKRTYYASKFRRANNVEKGICLFWSALNPDQSGGDLAEKSSYAGDLSVYRPTDS